LYIGWNESPQAEPNSESEDSFNNEKNIKDISYTTQSESEDSFNNEKNIKDISFTPPSEYKLFKSILKEK
jgi:hypothetical protein